MISQQLKFGTGSNKRGSSTFAYLFYFASLLHLSFGQATFVSEPVSLCAATEEFVRFSCATTSSSDLWWKRERSGVTTSVARNDVTLDQAYTVAYSPDPSEVSSMLIISNVTADMFDDAYYCEVEGQLSEMADLTEKICPFCEEPKEDFQKNMCTFWKINGRALPTCDEDLSRGFEEGLAEIELNFGQMSQQIGVQASVFVNDAKTASLSQTWNCSVEYSPLTFPEKVDLSVGDTLALTFSIDHPQQSAYHSLHVIIRSPNSDGGANTFASQFWLLSAPLILAGNQLLYPSNAMTR